MLLFLLKKRSHFKKNRPSPLIFFALKVDKAIYSMYRVWLAVAAVLTLQFARTINMALSIAEFLNRPCDRFLSPALQVAIPDEYDKWVPVVLRVSSYSRFYNKLSTPFF